jgi:serine/threonine protein kinase
MPTWKNRGGVVGGRSHELQRSNMQTPINTGEPIVREVFLRALEMGDSVERSRFLEAATVQQPELRQVVEGLLKAHKEDGFLERDLPQRSAVGSEVDADAKARCFGDYELLEELGRGGMGVVYKARHKTLRRVVAIKMMIAGRFCGEADVRRFYLEAEAAAKLQHPNIVAIHDIGKYEGRHFFSMDLIEGKSLAEVVKDGALSAGRAAGLVKTIAEAIAYAHERGVLHRDLKPPNIIIDAQGEPHIADFGLAKICGAEGLTQHGAVLGSPNYMPPEQAQGRAEEIGPHSDVFSMGAILYHLMTGYAPFSGDSALETLQQITQGEVRAPSKLNPMVPRDLEVICLKCLERSPRRRYATARELAHDLGRFLRYEPIHAQPTGIERRLLSWCLRHPWAVTALAAVGMLSVSGLAFWLWEQSRLADWKIAHPQLRPGRRVIPPFLAVWAFLSVPICLVVVNRLRHGQAMRFAWYLGIVNLAVGFRQGMNVIHETVWGATPTQTTVTAALMVFVICWSGLLLLLRAAGLERRFEAKWQRHEWPELGWANVVAILVTGILLVCAMHFVATQIAEAVIAKRAYTKGYLMVSDATFHKLLVNLFSVGAMLAAGMVATAATGWRASPHSSWREAAPMVVCWLGALLLELLIIMPEELWMLAMGLGVGTGTMIVGIAMRLLWRCRWRQGSAI